MIVQNAYPIAGLYDEMYVPDPTALSEGPLRGDGRESLRRASGLFWSRHLNTTAISELAGLLADSYRGHPPEDALHSAIIAAPAVFVEQSVAAAVRVADIGSGPAATFADIETLGVVCDLYSRLVYQPHKLTLQDGFLVPETSASWLAGATLDHSQNPYLAFILDACLPVIRKVGPDVLWALGPPRLSTLTMAALAKRDAPETHVSIVGHSSEYYSLNKIDRYLRRNTAIFSLVDSIVLDDTSATQDELLECLESGRPLAEVPNLMFMDRASGEIVQTEYRRVRSFPVMDVQRRRETSLGLKIEPSAVANVRLWPGSRCYWDRCAFCGINRKYQVARAQEFGDLDSKVSGLVDIKASGVDYVWLIDEAIPPATLAALAQAMLDRSVDIRWQARSRIDAAFTQETCALLAAAGLREIRLGLETASPRLLRLIDKFPDEFEVETVESVVSAFHDCGVSVHFPMIVGLPTESDAERRDTYDFLAYLKAKYPSFSFNVNVLSLDVSSRMFHDYQDYDICEIRWSTPPHDFLGNYLGWEAPGMNEVVRERIDRDRGEFMRQVLYPWIPRTALTTIPTFYRLAETSRATLAWKSGTVGSRQATPIDSKTVLQRCQNTVVSPVSRETWRGAGVLSVYDWDSHARIECDERAGRMLGLFGTPARVGDVIAQLLALFGDDDDAGRAKEKWMGQLREARDRHFLLEVDCDE